MKTKATLKRYKFIDWSYPSSDNAARFGFVHGCFTLHIGDDSISGHATLDEAKAAGEIFVGLPWHRSMSESWRSAMDMEKQVRQLCSRHPQVNYKIDWGCPECLRELREYVSDHGLIR